MQPPPLPLHIALFGSSEPERRAELRDRMQKDRLNLDAFKKREKEEKARRAAELKKVAKVKKPDKDAQWNNGVWLRIRRTGFSGHTCRMRGLVCGVLMCPWM